MTHRKMLRALQIAMALSIVTTAYAQDDQGSPDVSQPASSLSKKAMKAENRKLQKAVVRALTSAKGLSASNIIVAARQGVVVLRGSVTDAGQSQIATAVASSVLGVVVVKNELLIRPE